MNEQEQRLEHWMSRALRAGIWSSAVLMSIGLVGSALAPGTTDSSVLFTFSHFFSAIRSTPLAPGNFLFLGIVLLCSTPLARVLIAILGFQKEKDWRFVIVSAVVFILLLFEIVYAVSQP